jgi:hypothetical protein
MDDFLSDNQRTWQDGDTPNLTVTILDGASNPIPLSNVVTLKLDQWIAQGKGLPGLKINNRKGQNVLNANNVTVGSTSGLVTWQLQTADTAMQANDTTVLEEKHWYEFTLTYTAAVGTLQKAYRDYYIVQRKTVVK